MDTKKYTYLENSNITKLNNNYFFGDDLYITYNGSNKKCSYNISNFFININRKNNIESCIDNLKSTSFCILNIYYTYIYI